MTQTTISLPFITADAAGPKHLNTTLMRSTRRILDYDWHSTERNAEKSCSPRSTCAAVRMASTSSGR